MDYAQLESYSHLEIPSKMADHSTNGGINGVEVNTLESRGVGDETKNNADVEYEPYEHRKNNIHATSNTETLLHLIKGSVGAGLLAMPLAFKHAGLLTATIGTIIISFLASYCMHQLLRMQHHICKRQGVPQIEYSDAMKIAVRNGPHCFKWLTKPSPYIVDFFVSAYQLGICCAYVGFIAGTVKQMAEFYWDIHLDIRIWMLIVGVVITPLNQIRNLHYLSPLSAAGDFLLIGGLVIIYYFIFEEGMPSFEGKDWVSDRPFTGFALFFGTIMYSVQTIGVIVALENDMKTPADYRKPAGVFNVGMVIITLGYLFTGFFGYLKWGNTTQATITWNLPNNNALTECIKVMFAVLILLTYPLQCYVPIEIMWQNYIRTHVRKASPGMQSFYSTLLRALILWATVILSITVPFLDLLISIVGGFCLPTVGITFPAIMEICIFHNEGKLSSLMLGKNICLMIFGVFSCVLSTFVCLLEIYDKVK
uniref:Proton-coupled amino acid transporter 1 n=3 Tax=Cacopsylla melanoneura TaxID=428564 RepID=A0A8D9BJH3_9HEMI